MAGGTELTTYLNLIRQEKTNKIIPTNIKSGIEVLGITGEYTGIKTYSSVAAMNNDLANIQENEIAKVVVDNVTTYYIKNTTMKELYKEGTTLSPADYEQARVQIANLLNEDVSPYIELDYIQSSGTQYIDTGVQVKSGYKIEAKFNHTPNSNSFNAVFGGRTNWNDNQLTYCNRAEGSNTRKMIAYRYETKPTWAATYTGADVTMVYDKNVFTINDGTHTQTQTLTDYTFSDPHTLFIFGLNHNGAVETDSMINMKLYYFKIYDYGTETLLRDFIPVKRISDDEICLYDKVEGEFYTNDGTGDFIAGPEKY